MWTTQQLRRQLWPQFLRSPWRQAWRAGCLAALLCLALPSQAEIRRVAGLSFDSVLVMGSIDVEIRQGEEVELLLKGDSADLDKSPFVVTDDVLVLGYNPEYRNSNFSGVKYKLTTPGLSKLELKGSGDVYLRPFDAGDFSATVTGSGDMRLYRIRGETISLRMSGSGTLQAYEVEARDLEVAVSGSGNIHTGTVHADFAEVVVMGSGDVALHTGGAFNDIEISVMGSGDVELEPADTDTAEVNIVGSGDVKVGAPRALDVNIVGSGDVYYRGDPDISQSILGSGDLIPQD